jgi:cytochrome c-type biogenesis protein CcmE
MQHKRLKLAIAAIVLLGAVTYLAFAGLREGWVYHVDVDQYIQSSDLQQQRVRLVGKVSPADLQASPAKMAATFTMVGASGKSVRVAYRGTIPDLFKADSEVVVEGRRDVTGLFQADVLMTKCASKYQSDQHAKHDSKQG